MAHVYICPTEIFIEGFCRMQHDRHCADRRWHLHMMNFNENYQADIDARQAAKRAAGIGTEGRCHA